MGECRPGIGKEGKSDPALSLRQVNPITGSATNVARIYSYPARLLRGMPPQHEPHYRPAYVVFPVDTSLVSRESEGNAALAEVSKLRRAVAAATARRAQDPPAWN